MAELVLSEAEERQVEEGEAAATLLDSPIFLLAIERIRADCSEGILTSEPAHISQREALYNLSRGLSSVTAQLAQMQALAASIVENAALQSPNDDEDLQAEVPEDLYPSY